MTTNFLIEAAVSILLRPQRSIGGIRATVTLEEVGEDELEITSHPVEQGADITDNAFKKPTELKINALFNGEFLGIPTAIPTSLSPLNEIYQQLLALQSSRIPFDIVTGKRIYKNMLFKSLKNTTDRNTENCLSIQASFKEIIAVSVQVTSVPPRAKQAQPETTGATENAGDKAAQPFAPTQNNSALFDQLQVFGGI